MPNNNNTSNLFALVDDEDALIRRIPLTAAVNTELAQLFAEQQAALLNDRQPIAFTGSYNVDVGEIFTIADYPLPPAIGQAVLDGSQALLLGQMSPEDVAKGVEDVAATELKK